MFDKIQMILMMKTSISNNRISRLNINVSVRINDHSLYLTKNYTHYAYNFVFIASPVLQCQF